MAGYGDDSGLEAYADENGYDIPDSATPAVLRQKGSAYLDGAYEARFIGVRAGGYSQERAWPRTKAVMYGGQSIPDDAIPQAIIDASYEAAIHEALNPGSLQVSASNAQRVIKERVEGAVEVSYAAPSTDTAKDAALVLTAVEGMVAPFLIRGRIANMLVV